MYKEPNPMKEIHMIQEKIYDEQKHMTDKEKIAALHKEVEETEKKYGLTLKKVLYVK